MEDAEAIIRAELAPSERLLWAGRPRPGRMLRASDAYLIPFSIVWCGMMVFAVVTTMIGAETEPSNWWGLLFLVPFVLVGLYLLVGRFLVDARGRARTWYGVTSERALLVSSWFRK